MSKKSLRKSLIEMTEAIKKLHKSIKKCKNKKAQAEYGKFIKDMNKVGNKNE